MHSPVEEPTGDDRQSPLFQTSRKDNWHLNPRRRKETVLLQVTQLAENGTIYP